MIVLAFDTALAACSVGIWQGEKIVARESALMPQGHAEALMPMIERVMAAAGVTYHALDRIAVTVGPGSFTGLRVGIATARGLAMAAQKPAIGVTTTQALATAALAERGNGNALRILSIVDSKRDDVFAQVFTPAGEPESDILNLKYEALREIFPGPLVVVGDAAARALKHLAADAQISSAPAMCAVEHIASIASLRDVDPLGPLPVYVRAPDVTLRPDGGILRP
jgi:tRNA threonylcarbamoyladenosine biosynthesis protein TsaB